LSKERQAIFLPNLMLVAVFVHRTRQQNYFLTINKDKMQELLNDLLEKAKSNKKGLIMLKETAVRCQQFELAAELRQLENDFPEPQEVKDAIKYASNIQTALAMAEVRPIEKKLCWLIGKIIEKHTKVGGKLSLKDVAGIVTKRDELFINVTDSVLS
jgi:hypothetical protein